MSDRYLYKAKIKGKLTGYEELDWAKGNLVAEQSTGRYFIIDLAHFDSETKLRDVVIEVDPSTICQCTGLKDKNGQLIWENDIVELYDKINDYTWRAKVEFGNPNGLYSWGWQLAPIEKCEENPDILLWVEMEDIGVLCEVIGSAIDNPELLEGGAE